MRLEYSLDSDDLLAFATNQRESFKVKVSANWWWAGYLVVAIVAFSLHSGDVIGTMVMFVGFLLFFAMLQRPYTSEVLKKWYASENIAGLIGRRTFELHEDGFSERTEFKETRQKWNSEIEIRTTREHVFIYINRIQAYIIPARAFPDQKAFVLFTGELKDRARQAIASTSGAAARF